MTDDKQKLPEGVLIDIHAYVTEDETELSMVISFKNVPVINSMDAYEELARKAIESANAGIPANWRMMTPEEIKKYQNEEQDSFCVRVEED